MNENVEILKKVSFFSVLNDNDLLLLSDITKKIDYTEGTTIFKEGDKGGSLFIILEGTIKIYKETAGGPKKVLASLGKMDVFGELSVFDELPRSATAVVSTNSKCLMIDTDDLNIFMKDKPELTVRLLKEVIKTLSTRIRNTNEKLQNSIFWSLTTKL